MSDRYWLWGVPLVAAVVFVWLLGPILTPFVIAGGLAYLGDPMVDRLERHRLSRSLAVLVVFALLALILALLVLLLFPLLEQQIRTLIENLPRYLQWVQDRIHPWVQGLVPGADGLDIASIRSLIAEHWNQAGGIAAAVVKHAFSSGTALIAFFANLVLVPVITFYLLRDWDRLVARILDLLPRRWVPTVRKLARETDEVLGQFLRGQLLLMVFLGVVYTVGLWLAGLDLAFLIGLISGLVSFVPYLGVIVGLVLSTVAMLVQTGGQLLPLVWVALVFAVGQMLEGAILQPLVVGDRIGLHPVTVIFAVLAGGQLFGFVGVLLALPAAAALAVLVRHVTRQWRASRLYLEEEE
ncbi:MAG: AI-2E family transporter [Salinisphaera sp.]|nr:AI-2E family transporter [Salinisphaera sp.]